MMYQNNHNITDASEIIPRLWIGNLRSAHNKDFIREKNIKYFVNLTNTKNYFENYKDAKYLNKIIKDDNFNIDSCIDNMDSVFDEINNFILLALKNKQSILIYCKDGFNISSTVVASFLIKYMNLDFITAIIYLNSVRHKSLSKTSCIVNALYKYYLKNK